MALVKFYRGNRARYDTKKFTDGVYFSLDTKEIIVNGTSFGYSNRDHKEFQEVTYTAPNSIRFNFTNGSSNQIDLQYAVSGVSEGASKGGLMTQAQAYKLGKIPENSQANIIESVAVDGINIEPVGKKINIVTTPYKNQINRNKVAAKDNSIEVTPGSGEGNAVQPTKVNVKIAQNGGLQVTETGLRVDNTALEQYIGDDKAIVVDTTANSTNQKKVAFKVNPKAGNILSTTADGAFASVKLKRLVVPTGESNVATRYGLVGIAPNGSEINLGNTTIDILKDQFLKNVELGRIPDNQPSAGNDALAFTFTLADGTDIVRYVDVSSFLREAEAGAGLETNSSGKLVVKIDNIANEESSASTPYLQMDNNGLKIVGLNAELDKIKKYARTEIRENSVGHVLVRVTDQADGHSLVEINGYDIASAEYTSMLSGKINNLEASFRENSERYDSYFAEFDWHEDD